MIVVNFLIAMTNKIINSRISWHFDYSCSQEDVTLLASMECGAFLAMDWEKEFG